MTDDADAAYLQAQFGIKELPPPKPVIATAFADVVSPITLWSPQQQAIFRWFEAPPEAGNLVVRARAGTGKTTTIVEAVAHIAGEPTVLVCAFNKRIQLELSRRLSRAAGTAHPDALTLHSLGLRFVTNAWGSVSVDPQVDVDRVEQACEMIDGETAPWDVMAGLKKLVGIAKGVAPDIFDETRNPITRLTELCIAYGCDSERSDYPAEWFAKIALRALELALTIDVQARISFDDMLFVPAALNFALPLYDWVIVDEAQDMNLSQLRIAQAACKPGGHIVIVGDDRQAIYGFRGASSDAVDRMKRELNATELGLTTTYRCPKKVVQMAQGIVPDFESPESAHDGTVETIAADVVADTIRPGDVLLSRTNAPLVPLCLRLIRAGTGARIEGRDIGKLLVGRAKKLRAVNVEDFLAKLTQWSKRATSRAIAYGKAVDAKLEQIRDLEDTLAALATDAESVEQIYERCNALFADVANPDGTPNLVVLSTVHKAKGLEWRRVFVLEDTFYFYGKKMEDREEANIHYVALTRTMQHLVIVRSPRE